MICMKIKRKQVLIIITIIIAVVVLAYIGIRLYVINNYDIKLITDSGGNFFIFSTSFKKYYLVNSSLGIKIRTTEFDIDAYETPSEEQLQHLQELAETDDKYIFSESRLNLHYIFFYENYIFYTRYYGEGGPHISEEDWEDMQENIYKYNIDAKEIEQIKKEEDSFAYISGANLRLEALNYLYPGLKQAIADKCGRVGDKAFYFSEVYYGEGRILFTTSFSSSARGTTQHFYEYFPETGETKKSYPQGLLQELKL